MTKLLRSYDPGRVKMELPLDVVGLAAEFEPKKGKLRYNLLLFVVTW